MKNKEDKNKKNHIIKKIIVNAITGLRTVGSIALLPIFLSGGSFSAALASIGFFVTDFIDGRLARSWHVESFFGSLLDGLTDKIFGVVCLILLATYNPIFLAIVALELGIIGVNYKSAQRGNNIQSSILGKAKTLLLAGSIVGSFFCMSLPTVQEVLKYINVSSLDKLMTIDPKILTTILGSIGASGSAYVLYDYSKRAKKQDEMREERMSMAETQEPELTEEVEQKRDFIKEKRDLLVQKKELLVLKTKGEIVHDLFDTDFYIEHKDDGIKRLLYK